MSTDTARISNVVVEVKHLAYLMCDIRPGIADVAVHLAHNSDVFVTVQQRKLFLSTGHPISARTSMTGFISLQAGIRKDDDQALCVFVVQWNWYMLLRGELWQLWWW
jgi:hypothetical protein